MKTIRLRAIMLLLLTVVFSFNNLNAQTITVSGKVTDAASKKPVKGCSVRVIGMNKKTVTNANGIYSIQVAMGRVLSFSCNGYVTKKLKVKVKRLNVSLKPEDLAESAKDIVQIKQIPMSVIPEFEDEKVYCMVDVAPQQIKSRAFRPFSAQRGVENAEEYRKIQENGFLQVKDIPLSTFSIDVDAASYSNMRRLINDGGLPPADAIRTEELVNYFTYNYPKPTGKSPVNITTEVGDCPWNTAHRLVRIGLKAQEIPTRNLPASNLVFLIDVSGSMYGAERLELVKSSLKLLVNNLREKDQVAIVIYAGAAGLKLESTSGSDKQKIKDALDNLTAEGSTAGGEGILLAYKTARNSFIPDGNNRIILCTDGDFNVGVSSNEGLEKLIEAERKSGVFLTVLGYGMGNYKDSKMQILAEKGNGNHAYIDNLQEANRVLVNEFGATLHAVAKDVKLQVEFNPSQVQAYRLIGYESRLLKDEDFNNDAKDAGELGAGHTVTAFYEVIPVGVENDYVGKVDDLKYQKKPTTNATLQTTNSPELLTVKLRYKAPGKDVSKKLEFSLTDPKGNNVSADFCFASAVAMFGQLLRESDYKGDASYDKVIDLAKQGLDSDEKGYRREFIRLVESAKGLEKGK